MVGADMGFGAVMFFLGSLLWRYGFSAGIREAVQIDQFSPAQ
jgi:hypothetical protein